MATYTVGLHATFLASLGSDDERRKAKVVFAGGGKNPLSKTMFRLNRDEGLSVAGPVLEIKENTSLEIEDVDFEQMVKYNANIRAQMADMITRKIIVVMKAGAAQTAANIRALVAP